MRILLLTIFLLLTAGALSAQKECHFATLMAEGKALFEKQNFRAALKKFNAARTCDASQSKAVDEAISRLFDAIERQRDEAKAQRDEAQKQRKRAEAALKQAEIEKQRTQVQIAKNKKLIDAFYFYEGRLALAYKNDRFGFIDTAGNVVIDYQYEKAEQFDEPGFAKVMKDQGEYLLDADGNEYKVAYSLETLDEFTTALDLRGKPLDSFPAEILAHPQLEVLIFGREAWMDRGKFGILPAEIGQLQQLVFLDLANMYLKILPAEIGALKNLKFLNLKGNKLETLPAEFRELKNLKTLNLYGNYLSVLPEGIGAFKNLTWLDLSQNALKILPAEIGQLQNLQTANLGGNYLSTLPEQIGGLQSLQELYLFQNQFTTLPATIGKLKNLKKLDLTENKLSALPAQIGTLTNLESLELGENQFKTLPAEIGTLKKLQRLFLSRNPLEVLPPDMGALKNLYLLYLDHNRIQTLPPSIGTLKSLKHISLYGNNNLVAASVLHAFRNFPKPIDLSTDEYEFMLGKDERRLLLILDKKVAETGEIGELRRLRGEKE
jgi:Leucine-rich repeat (LRR) protein